MKNELLRYAVPLQKGQGISDKLFRLISNRPTNDAFAKLPEEVVASLTDPDNVASLTDVLLYHGMS